MLYFKQIEIGPMQNYVYLIGSTETRKVAVVDAAWEIDTILKIAAQDDLEVTHGRARARRHVDSQIHALRVGKP